MKHVILIEKFYRDKSTRKVPTQFFRNLHLKTHFNSTKKTGGGDQILHKSNTFSDENVIIKIVQQSQKSTFLSALLQELTGFMSQKTPGEAEKADLIYFRNAYKFKCAKNKFASQRSILSVLNTFVG